jgi:hypothetical protein
MSPRSPHGSETKRIIRRRTSPEGGDVEAATGAVGASVSQRSDKDLKAALDDAHVPARTADAVVATKTQSRINGLRSALAILALISLVALLFTRGIPTVQPGAIPEPNPPPI